MSRYFPRHTRELQAIEPPGFKRLTLSLAEMAVITGVIIRLLRAVTLSYGFSENLLYIASAIALGSMVFFGMTALHLANFTLRHWIWRAPAFGLAESIVEMGVSAALTLLGREPMGTGRAVLDQWWELAARTIIGRTLAACLFAAALAGVISIMRRVVLAKETDAKAAENLRAELFSEAPEAEIDKTGAV